MKKTVIALFAIFALTAPVVHAYDLKGLLGGAAKAVGNSSGSDVGKALGALGGLLGQSNVEVKDLAGTWMYSKPAVSFQSDNFLKQAGGAVAAQAIENKLLPYYTQFGIDKMELEITGGGNFTFVVRNIPIKGTLRKDSDGNFTFNFQAFGTTNLGKVKAYITKSGNSIDLTFDVTRIMELATKVLSSTGNSNLSTISSLLDSYEGLSVGCQLNNIEKGNGSNSKNKESML